jgi:hypothetical protein
MRRYAEDMQKSKDVLNGAISSLPSNPSSMPASIQHLTMQDVLEMREIASDANLKRYCESFEKVFNEAFLSAVLMSSGQFRLEPSLLSKSLSVTASMLNDVPFAAMVLSLGQKAVDTVNGSIVKASYRFISELNRNGNLASAGHFSELIARKCTLLLKDGIVAASKVTSKKEVSSRKSFLVNLMRELVDEESSKRLLGTRIYSAVELLALQHSKEALQFILEGSVSDEEDTMKVIDRITSEVTGKSMTSLPVLDTTSLPLPPIVGTSTSSTLQSSIPALTYAEKNDVKVLTEKFEKLQNDMKNVKSAADKESAISKMVTDMMSGGGLSLKMDAKTLSEAFEAYANGKSPWHLIIERRTAEIAEAVREILADNEAASALRAFEAVSFNYGTTVKALKRFADSILGTKNCVRETRPIISLSRSDFIYIDKELKGGHSKAPLEVYGSQIIFVLNRCGLHHSRYSVEELQRELEK